MTTQHKQALVVDDLSQLKEWLQKSLKPYERRLNPAFRGTVTAVAVSVPPQPSGFLCSIQRTNDSAADGGKYLCASPTYIPCVGDLVECMWRDNVSGWILWPLDKTAAPAPSGVNGSVSTLVIAGTDLSGDITFNTTGAIAASTQLFSVIFARPYPVVPKITATGIVGVSATWFAIAKGQTGFTVYTGPGLGIAAGWALNYVVSR